MKTFDNLEQRTPEWFLKRAGTISGTRLKGIMGTLKKRKDTQYEILAEKLSVGIGEQNYENPMDRGTRLESVAIAEFELETGKKIKQTGFAENDDNPKIANSPDGIIDDTDNTEMVEIKCPGGKNYVKYVIENKIPEDYIWQVVQYFTVNEELKKLYFIVYNPDIICHPMHVIIVLKKDIDALIKRALKTQTVVLQEIEAMYRVFPGVKESFKKL